MAFPVFFSSYRRLASLPILLQRFFIIGISIFGPLAQRMIFYKKTAAGTPAAVDGSLFYLQSGSGAQRPTSERRSSLLCSSAQVMLQALVNSSSLRPLSAFVNTVLSFLRRRKDAPYTVPSLHWMQIHVKHTTVE